MSLANTAVILAGGKSSRMGFDKQLIKVKDICITEHLIEMLTPMFKNIIVVTNKPELYRDKNIIIAEDVHKGYGPIGGIHAGLSKSQSMFNYFIACDMPNVNKLYIKYMINRMEENFFKNDAVITKKADWIESFNAFYSKSLIPAIEDNIKKGRLGIMELLEISDVLYIDEAIARGFDPDWSMFTNLNTREDLEGLV